MNQDPTTVQLTEKIDTLAQTVQDTLEIVQFLHTNAATKSDIADVRDEMATKSDIAAIRDEMATKSDIADVLREIQQVKLDMIGHVDGFIALYRKHEFELAAVVSRLERTEEKLNKIVVKLGLGSI